MLKDFCNCTYCNFSNHLNYHLNFTFNISKIYIFLLRAIDCRKILSPKNAIVIFLIDAVKLFRYLL